MTALLLLAMMAAQAQTGAPARDSRVAALATATISGRVTEQGSGRPLPRMVVTLTTTDRSKAIEAMTDAGGRYEFTGVEAGKYAIVAGPDEHRSTFLSHRFGDTAPLIFVGGLQLPPSVELTAAETRTGVDIALSRALGIEGRVTDPWDDAIAGAQVEVRRADGRLHFGNAVYSDDLGFYRVYGLAPGRYRVCASMQDRSGSNTAPAKLVATCHPAAIVETAARDIVLTTQDATGVDIRVQRVGSHSISGTVSGPSGGPIDGAEISAYLLGESRCCISTRSGNGAFALHGLTPGRYVIKATLGDPHREDPRPPGRELQIGYASADVDVVDVTGVGIDLSKPARAAGRVVFDGSPAPPTSLLRLAVQASPPDVRRSMLEGRPPVSPVGDDLTFELTGLYRLPLILGVSGLPEGWVVKYVRDGNRDVTHLPIDFGSRPSPGGLEIVLTNRVARPSIRITDPRGAPATAFQVLAVPVDPARRHLLSVVVPGRPSGDGVLKVSAILPGEYFLAALPTEDVVMLMRDPERIDSVAAVGIRVTLEERDDRTFDLRPISLPPRQ
jgi:hypothetical protein